MRMGWTRHDSVGKQKLLTEKIFVREFQLLILHYLLDFANIYHYHENTKQLNN